MNKPDTKEIRDNLKNPIVLPFGTCIPPEVYETTRNVLELCDYIDSQVECGTNCCRGDKVTVAQIREFVEEYKSGGFTTPHQEELSRSLLDFIDNGPKKPTAEDVARNAYSGWANNESDSRHAGRAIVDALREAGLLKEDS